MPAKSPSSSIPQLLSGVICRDAIEDMAGAVSNFFNLEAMQLEPGLYRGCMDFIAAGNVFLYRENYPLRTHLRGELLHNRFGFAVPARGPRMKFSGEDTSYHRLASAMTGEELDVHAPAGVQQFVVLLDHQRLLTLAEDCGLPDQLKRSLRSGRDTMPLVTKPRDVANFGKRLQNLLHLASIGELEVDPARLEDWIYTQALSMFDVKDMPLGRPTPAVLVGRALTLAEAQEGPARIAEICQQLRVSPGTLQKAFRHITGLSPLAYFLRRRLNEARSTLLKSDPSECRVTDVALRLGFSELGRFAVRYRQLFGESPSDTLRRSNRATVHLSGR